MQETKNVQSIKEIDSKNYQEINKTDSLKNDFSISMLYHVCMHVPAQYKRVLILI